LKSLSENFREERREKRFKIKVSIVPIFKVKKKAKSQKPYPYN